MFYMLAGPLGRAVKIHRIVIDNHMFRLHYNATTLLLVFFSILVTSTQYFGDPISCVQHDSIPNNVLKTFCWLHGTFNLPEKYNTTVGPKGVPYSGIDKYTPGEHRKYFLYYQWVCFVLFLQAVTFYAPHWFWKLYEGGLVRRLTQDLDCPVKERTEVWKKAGVVAKYISTHLGLHACYFYAYVLCECLNFINVIAQILITDHFLGNMFTTFGTDVIKYDEMNPEIRNDPMSRVFPRMTKCTFHMFGTSGDVQKYDALCILAQNIINEKIYIFLWFWWVLLAMGTGIAVGYRLGTLLMPRLRHALLKRRARVTDRRTIDTVMRRLRSADWFLVYLLSKNMHPVHYRIFLQELSKEFSTTDGSRLLNKENESNTSTV